MGQEEEVFPGLQSEGSSFHASQILPAPIPPEKLARGAHQQPLRRCPASPWLPSWTFWARGELLCPVGSC